MELHDVVEIILLLYTVTEAYNNLKEVQEARPYKRSMWVSPFFRDRDSNGFFAKSFERLHAGDTVQFRQAVGMSSKLFDQLFELLEEDLTKFSNRPSISAKCRLFLTLVYLTNGSNPHHLSEKFKMGVATVKRIIKDTCEVLWDKLSVDYLSVPSYDKWLQLAHEYETRWNLPHCVGALDAKLINLSKPNLMVWAICDANYNFTCIDFGIHDIKKNDGAVQWSTKESERFFDGDIQFLKGALYENMDIEFPYYVVGDAAFPLKPYLMRPYPGLSLSPDREMFNMRIFPARGSVENAFGVLKARWKILLGPPTLKVKTVEFLVKAIVVLHNYINMNDPTYCPDDFVDSYNGEQFVKGFWRQEVTALKKAPRMHSNNAAKQAFTLRDQLKDYLLVSEEVVYSDFEV